jgi:hypothetical protein
MLSSAFQERHDQHGGLGEGSATEEPDRWYDSSMKTKLDLPDDLELPLVQCAHKALPAEEMTPERVADVLLEEEAGLQYGTIFEEAEEHRRRHPVPPMEEVLKESRRLRESLPRNLDLPDSTTLLREDRG